MEKSENWKAINPLWRLADPLTVQQAAALIAGFDPNAVRFDGSGKPTWFEINGYTDSNGIGWVQTAFTALVNAIDAGRLSASYASNANEAPDYRAATVKVSDLVAWLEAAGIRTGFFFPAATDTPDYLDPKNPRYAPKLAAAVRAWQAVVDPGGRHPKQALVKWLREHAAEFGLTDAEGRPNETGIEEISKVANWQPGGGAPKTPSE